MFRSSVVLVFVKWRCLGLKSYFSFNALIAVRVCLIFPTSKLILNSTLEDVSMKPKTPLFELSSKLVNFKIHERIVGYFYISSLFIVILAVVIIALLVS